MQALLSSRRSFLQTTLLGAAGLGALSFSRAAEAPVSTDLPNRIHGLLLGAFLGDALGGPIEFQPPDKVQGIADPPKRWHDDELLDDAALAATANRLRLRSYHELRPEPESYGQWNVNSAPGTVTDDSRHKLLLLHGLRRAEARNAWPFDVRALAQAHLDWPEQSFIRDRPAYRALCDDWLAEWQLGARWVLGERDPARALPPERMWVGLPTCCGQMTLPPLAALFAGRPDDAYRAAFQLAFFDNGIGRDLNAVLVAGLAQALVTPVDALKPTAAWDTVLRALRETDPYRFRKVRWTHRAVDRWLDFAERAATEAGSRPARMFAALEREFATTTKWEAQVPVSVAFACIRLARHNPLAALQLSLEWGHDSDSYSSLLGAFVGALHGPDIFPAAWRTQLADRLRADFNADFNEEVTLLVRLQQLGRSRKLVADD